MSNTFILQDNRKENFFCGERKYLSDSWLRNFPHSNQSIITKFLMDGNLPFGFEPVLADSKCTKDLFSLFDISLKNIESALFITLYTPMSLFKKALKTILSHALWIHFCNFLHKMLGVDIFLIVNQFS